MVKGSRDPLGFQVLWQAAGREMIPHLSTVSNSIRDFQVISMADHCRRNFQIAEQDYLSFFLCFEQLMGYTRFFQSDGNDSFNGIDKVRKLMVTISCFLTKRATVSGVSITGRIPIWRYQPIIAL
jgi:hypothetical protein